MRKLFLLRISRASKELVDSLRHLLFEPLRVLLSNKCIQTKNLIEFFFVQIALFCDNTINSSPSFYKVAGSVPTLW